MARFDFIQTKTSSSQNSNQFYFNKPKHQVHKIQTSSPYTYKYAIKKLKKHDI